MFGSVLLLARRALTKLLLKLAMAYNVVISVNRDSLDTAVQAAFRKVVLKVGGHYWPRELGVGLALGTRRQKEHTFPCQNPAVLIQ